MANRAQRTILVVEDEMLIRMLAVEALEEEGWAVVDFDTADAAIAYVMEHHDGIRAVFTDINMPGKLDGLDLAALIARTQPQVAIVVTSGHYHQLPSTLRAEAQFLPKPWRSDQLLEALKEAGSDRKRPRS